MTPKLPSSLFTGPLFQTAGATVSEFSRQTQIEREKKYEQEFDHFWHGDADGHLCLANERSLLTGVVEIIPKSGPKKSSELFSFYPFFGII